MLCSLHPRHRACEHRHRRVDWVEETHTNPGQGHSRGPLWGRHHRSGRDGVGKDRSVCSSRSPPHASGRGQEGHILPRSRSYTVRASRSECCCSCHHCLLRNLLTSVSVATWLFGPKRVIPFAAGERALRKLQNRRQRSSTSTPPHTPTHRIHTRCCIHILTDGRTQSIHTCTHSNTQRARHADS
jgi:hypothetical protein